ncbi:MAG: 4Fe-4S dicluster domain-containing protein [Planctomycetaceae bacterium]|nr:MAG: 4Fe-4S dicluster domain-containing protein [Planctomycetaceae bacterium]
MDSEELSRRRELATQTIDFAAASAGGEESAKPFDDEGLFARDIDGRLVRVKSSTAADFDTDIRLTIDGRAVTVKKAMPLRDSQGSIRCDAEGNAIPRPTTIYDAASEAFVHSAGDVHPIPTLCHREHMTPVGVCRICMVEAVEQTRRGTRSKLVPSCVQQVTDGMEVHTIQSRANPEAATRVKNACRTLAELLVADHLPQARGDEPEGKAGQQGEPGGKGAPVGKDAPNAPAKAAAVTPGVGNELAKLAERLGISKSRFSSGPGDLLAGQTGQLGRTGDRHVAPAGAPAKRDRSSRMVIVDSDQCILCARCVRGCNQIKGNHVIGKFGKGYASHIGFDLDDPMGKSSCVSCGECVISCPTGALEFQPAYLAANRGTDGPEVDVRELLAIPLFSGLPPKFIQFNQSAFQLRKVAAGEVLCREGEQGSTAFVIVDGRFEVSLKSRGRAESRRRSGFWRFWERRGQQEDGNATARIQDLNGTKLGENVRIEITPADVILGEMTCLNNYPRSATVVAVEPSTVVEIRRNVLYMIRRNEVSREFLDRVYRDRSLQGQLASLPIFEGLNDDQRQQAAEYLRERVGLISVEPGQTIFRQDEPADAVYINRLGFVKTTQRFGVSERVLGYVSPGNYFGEVGLLTKSLGVDGVLGTAAGAVKSKLPAGRHNATYSALDHVELIRIRGKDFEELMRRFPQLLAPMVLAAGAILRREHAVRKQIDVVGADDFLDQGLFLSQSLLVLDLERCTRCDECTKACADTHGGVTRLVREGLRFDRFLVASSCRSCLDPYCLVGCPVDAIHRNGDSMEIRIEDYCIGCGLCAQNCPYGNINMHGFPKLEADPRSGKLKPVYEDRGDRKIPVIQQKATTCDLCRSLDGKPSCVYACPHDAAYRMSGEQLLRIIDRDGKAELG